MVDIGDVAEDQVRLWASKAGIVVSWSKRDRSGWDARLEVRRDGTLPQPLDQLPSDVICDVQVKGTTDQTKASWSIKLSNFERHAKHALPFFFIILVLEDDGSVRDTFAVHVDREWVERVLKRLRELEKAGTPRDQLHRRTLSLKWSDQHRIEPTPQGLRSVLLDGIGDPSTYVHRKLTWIQTVGYDATPVRATITFPETTNNAHLAELALGLRQTVRASRLVTQDVRFGIPVPLVDHAEEAELSIDAPSIGTSTLEVSSADSGERASFPVETRTSFGVFPFLPREHWKLRCHNEFISTITTWDKKETELSVTLGDPTAPQSLGAVREACRFLRLALEERETPNQIRVVFDFAEPPVPPLTGQLLLADAAKYTDFLERALVVEAAWRLAAAANVPSDVKVMLAELARFEDEIRLLDKLVKGSDDAESIVTLKRAVGSTETLAMAAETAFVCGDFVVVGLGGVAGAATPLDEDGLRFRIQGRTVLHGPWMCARADYQDWRQGPGKRLLREAVEKLEAQWGHVLVPTLSSIME